MIYQEGNLGRVGRFESGAVKGDDKGSTAPRLGCNVGIAHSLSDNFYDLAQGRFRRNPNRRRNSSSVDDGGFVTLRDGTRGAASVC